VPHNEHGRKPLTSLHMTLPVSLMSAQWYSSSTDLPELPLVMNGARPSEPDLKDFQRRNLAKGCDLLPTVILGLHKRLHICLAEPCSSASTSWQIINKSIAFSESRYGALVCLRFLICAGEISCLRYHEMKGVLPGCGPSY
jgi:hypothetical protein